MDISLLGLLLSAVFSCAVSVLVWTVPCPLRKSPIRNMNLIDSIRIVICSLPVKVFLLEYTSVWTHFFPITIFYFSICPVRRTPTIVLFFAPLSFSFYRRNCFDVKSVWAMMDAHLRRHLAVLAVAVGSACYAYSYHPRLFYVGTGFLPFLFCRVEIKCSFSLFICLGRWLVLWCVSK